MPDSPRPASVLLVEDDPGLRNLYRRALAASRFKVAAVADGLSALAALENDCPDVVVLDLALPRVSGWDVYRDLRGKPETAALPVVVVTGNDLRDIRRADATRVLEKPVDPVTLVSTVEQALARS